MVTRRRRRSQKKEMVKDSHISAESLPPDLVIELLKRLPVKAVSRFILVSKLWSSIISSQDFIRSFPLPLIPPRLLFAVNAIDKGNGHYKWFFYSSSSTRLEEDNRVLSSLSHTKCEIPNRCLCDVHYVNGLIGFGYGEKQIITNPSTGKSIFLPKVRSRKQITRSYFGFDPVDCQHKVLVCMSERVSGHHSNVPSSEHQVFTLMGREGRVAQPWRVIECNYTPPHCPKTNGVCINGVLYYGASTGKKMLEWCLVRFDVRTEKLDLLCRFTDKVQSFDSPCLINYQGKVTLAFTVSFNKFDLWVMENAKKMTRIGFSIYWSPYWTYPAHECALHIIGTIHTGEIVLLPCISENTSGKHCVVYYDHKQNSFTKRWVYSKLDKQFQPLSVMLPSPDYAESALSFFSF